MSKHTPGPWRLGISGHAVVSDSTDGTHCSESEINYYGGALVCESVKSEANARLIAAAPDLLEALEEYFQAYDENPHLGPRGSKVDKAFVKARAAIAKATGEKDE